MKILFTTLNSKFIHSNLAIKYISKCIHSTKATTKEYTINEDIEQIFFDIVKGGYDIVAFSCYIWNIEKTLKIMQNIKKAQPHMTIMAGGPEVSYDVEKFMDQNPEIDLVIAGEGEEAACKIDSLLKDYQEGKESSPGCCSFVSYVNNALQEGLIQIPNLYLRSEGEIHNYSTPQTLQTAMVVQDLSLVPWAYEGITREEIKNKIIYYETSRGCNYNCSYCLSATQKGIRFFEEERVFEELAQLVRLGAKQIKFVDRTFNSDPARTKNLMEYIQTIDDGEINFHFEITAHLLTKEQIGMLKSARTGLFQLEIGVQSTNTETLVAVNRGDYFSRLKENVLEIKKAGNIHQHLDLIAGLPYEGLSRFKQSFNDVFELKPEMLQLGFLKLLKGSPIYSQIDQYEYQFRSYAPYEVLSNRFMQYGELIELKEVENIVDRYYNKQRYKYALEYIYASYPQGYDLFKDLADIIRRHQIEINQKNEEFRAVALLSEELGRRNKEHRHELLLELLRLDYLMMGRNPNLPDFLKSKQVASKELVFELLSDEQNRKELGFDPDTTAKEAFKKINWSVFDYEPIVYYNEKKIIKNNNLVLINYGFNKNDMESYKMIRRDYEIGN